MIASPRKSINAVRGSHDAELMGNRHTMIRRPKTRSISGFFAADRSGGRELFRGSGEIPGTTREANGIN
jgi:hypothetical protein